MVRLTLLGGDVSFSDLGAWLGLISLSAALGDLCVRLYLFFFLLSVLGGSGVLSHGAGSSFLFLLSRLCVDYDLTRTNEQ